MTVNSLQTREVSDLCIGKPATRPLSLSATVGDALLALRSGGSDDRLVICTADGPAPERKACAGNVCLVDVLCYLCAEQNLDAPMAALGAPASALLPPLTAASLVRRVEPSCSILEALDAILDGAQSLVVPIRAAASPRKFTSGSAAELCWLTREDFVRFFLNSIALFSPVPALSVTDLRLIGEISPFTLAHCDERVAPALAALSAGDLMTFVDCVGAPRKSAMRSIRAQLRAKGLLGMLELLDADVSPPFSPSTSSSESDDESSPSSPPLSNGRGRPRVTRSAWRSGSYSARMGRRSEEAIVCHPWSSLVAVMIQALAHRVSYVWVVDDDDYYLDGIVTFSDILEVFREQLEQTGTCI
ncbi:CBS domain-containing protein CBSX5-like [Musa acuminata AAA Group]|uniref:CBS domain-containing protein CBSX5-like n=1 Tax=Musa acuminata AAA Group TaxID=214697 RepID=UPI0031E078C5